MNYETRHGNGPVIHPKVNGIPYQARHKKGILMVAPWHDAIAAAGIVLSAGTYLFDFGSNVVVVAEYSTNLMQLLHPEKEGISSCNAVCRQEASAHGNYLYGMLAVLACCHSLNALLFKLKFTHNEAPLCAAYFLPLIHLYRLSHLLWLTLSCKGIHDLRSPEMNGLYCILGSAMEGVPMLILQFCGYLQVLSQGDRFAHSLSTTFKVSIAASLLSAAYNGGTSVQSIAKNATTFKQKLGAGAIGASFILSATLVRCLTFVYLILYFRQYFAQQWTEHERSQDKFHVSDSIPLVFMAGSIVAYSLYFWLLHSPRDFSKSLRDPHRLLIALAFSYMSMIVSPLYALISQANDAKQLGGYIFRLKLLALSLLHLLLDLGIMCTAKVFGTLPKRYLIVSLLAAVGYVVFLIAYMKFDVSCGPILGSSDVATTDRRTDDESDVIIPLSELFTPTNAHSQESQAVADAVSDVHPSSPNSNAEGCFPSRKHNISTHPHDVDLLEAKGHECRPLLTSSLSLGSITIKRESSCMVASSSLNNRPVRAYSERF